MRLIILGEIILDKYYYTITNRKAPEADIPVYLVTSTESKLGGAANVALNLNTICDVEFISVIGYDNFLDEITLLLEEKKIKYQFFKENRKSIIKNRIICENKITNRYDYEDTFDISVNIQDDIYKYIESKINNIDGIIISDYNKGIIPEELCINLINLCNKNNVLTFIDPKVNNLNKYKNCSFLKPNYKEALEILNLNNNEKIEDIIIDFYKKVNCKYLMITDGENGIIGYDNKNIIKINHNRKINVIDVTGAGDIVLSVFTYIYLLTNDFNFAINISNNIAGKSVEYLGNYKFTIDDIKECNKVIYSYESELINNISKLHKNIVFTNGCFDLVHIGHLKLLNFAKKQGDILILGLNSDTSIKNIKGESRPINNVQDRIEFLYLLNIIDYIIVFDEDTPLNIIKNLKPDVLIKGGDYIIENVIGREYAKEVLLYNIIPDKSTSLIIKKINNK